MGKNKCIYRPRHRDTNDDRDTGNINDDRDTQREITDWDTGTQMTTRTQGYINDDRDTGTHWFRSIPHDSNDCPWALLMVIANRRFPVSPSLLIYRISPVPPGVPVVVVTTNPGSSIYISTGPVSRSSFDVPVSQSVISDFINEGLGRHLYSLCPGRHLYIPVSRSVYKFVFELVFF